MSTTVEARVLGEHENFTASVDDPFSCSESVNVRIDSNQSDAFKSNVEGLSKMVGLVRIALSFECPETTEIAFVGYSNQKEILRANVAQSNSWQLSELTYTAQSMPQAAPVSNTPEESRPQMNLGSGKLPKIILSEEQVGWLVYRRKPLGNEIELESVVHDPEAFTQSPFGNVRIEAKRDPSPVNGRDYDYRFLVATDVPYERNGSININVDGNDVYRFEYKQGGKPIRIGNDIYRTIVESLLSGQTLNIVFDFPERQVEVSMPIDIVGTEEYPHFNGQAMFEETRLFNNCVKRNGGHRYSCVCEAQEFVRAAPVKNGLQTEEREAAVSTARKICETRMEKNPLLAETPYPQLLIGATLNQSRKLNVPELGVVNGAARIEKLLIPGPAHSIGLRTGDVIVDSASTAGLQSILETQMFSLGSRPTLTIWRPGTKTLRVVRLPIGMPSPDIKAAVVEPIQKESTETSGSKNTNNDDSEPTNPATVLNAAGDSIAASEAVAQAEIVEPPKMETALEPKDSYYQKCNADYVMTGIYDCACFAGRADEYRAKMAAANVKANAGLINRERMRLASNEEELEKERQKSNSIPKTIADIERRIASAKQRIAEMENPGPGFQDEAVMGAISSDGFCRDGSGLNERTRKDCLKNGKSEPVCECAGNAIEEKWMTTKEQYNSGWIVSNTVAAYSQCE